MAVQASHRLPNIRRWSTSAIILHPGRWCLCTQDLADEVIYERRALRKEERMVNYRTSWDRISVVESTFEFEF